MHLFEINVFFVWIFRCQCKIYNIFIFLESSVTKGFKYSKIKNTCSTYRTLQDRSENIGF